MNKKLLILILLNLFFIGGTFAQVPAEFAAGSMNPIPNGPTTASQTATLLANPSDSIFVPTNPPINVTASLSNQQYVGERTTPDNAVVMFGATDNPVFNGGSNARPQPVFAPMNTIGSPSNSMFSSDQGGTPTGIDVNVNYAFNLFTSVQHFKDQSVPSTNNVPIYMADLTLTFSQPVTNPYLHLVALGARTGSINGSPILGFATEFTLVTPGYTLEKVVGNNALAVTPTMIKNANITGIRDSCANNTAACGTVRVRGSLITSITFKVFVRGDGGNSFWGFPQFHTGDQWMIGVSVPAPLLTAAGGSVSGTLRSGGTPLEKTLVVLTDPETNQKYVTRTDGEGNYNFSDLRVGKGYIVQPLSSKYAFSPGSALVNLNDNVSELNFAASRKTYRPKNDFDGDGKTDVAVFRPSDGNWYVLNSSTGEMSVFNFGTQSDIPVSGDFDGDGRTDFAVFRPSDRNWYIWQSATQNLRVENFGLATDKLVPADYDGDGRTDIAVYRSGAWFILKSADNSVSYLNFGLEADTPVAADYDGDGRADISVYRPQDRTWFVYRTSGNDVTAEVFGIQTDVPVPGDFDGDGRADIAQFRSGIWYVQNSVTGFEGVQFGVSADRTVVGDFDGDGRADTTVFRNGAWFIRNSGSGTVNYINFGLSSDIVIQ